MDIWDIDKLQLFIMFVIPGFISQKVYQLMYPGSDRTGSDQIINAVGYSCINYGVMFLPIVCVESYGLKSSHPTLYLFFYYFVLLFSPILLVLAWRWIRTTQIVQNSIPHPTGKAWDFVFSQRKPYWVKIVLRDGTELGGYFGDKSFASSAPEPEQIYIEETWLLDSDGTFERPQNRSAGTIVVADDISYIELRN